MMLRLLLMVVSAWPCWAMAGDIAGDIRRGGSEYDPEARGYFEIYGYSECSYRSGVSFGRRLYADRSGCRVGLDLAGVYHYKRFFLEAVSHSRDGLQVGFDLWSNADWRIDVIGSPQLNGGEARIGIGPRITHYFGDNIFQFRLLSEPSLDEDVVATTRLGRAWQVRNWNFHALGGLEMRSLKSNYVFLVEEEGEKQVQQGRKRFEPVADVTFELGATYPISEHWVSRTQMIYVSLDQEPQGGRNLTTDWYAAVNTSLVYVF